MARVTLKVPYDSAQGWEGGFWEYVASFGASWRTVSDPRGRDVFTKGLCRNLYTVYQVVTKNPYHGEVASARVRENCVH